MARAHCIDESDAAVGARATADSPARSSALPEHVESVDDPTQRHVAAPSSSPLLVEYSGVDQEHEVAADRLPGTTDIARAGACLNRRRSLVVAVERLVSDEWLAGGAVTSGAGYPIDGCVGWCLRVRRRSGTWWQPLVLSLRWIRFGDGCTVGFS